MTPPDFILRGADLPSVRATLDRYVQHAESLVRARDRIGDLQSADYYKADAQVHRAMALVCDQRAFLAAATEAQTECENCEGTGKDTHDGAVLFDCADCAGSGRAVVA